MKKYLKYIIPAVIFLAYNIITAILANNGYKAGAIMFFTEIAVIVGITIVVIVRSIRKK